MCDVVLKTVCLEETEFWACPKKSPELMKFLSQPIVLKFTRNDRSIVLFLALPSGKVAARIFYQLLLEEFQHSRGLQRVPIGCRKCLKGFPLQY
jgi:hypothetical protein